MCELSLKTLSMEIEVDYANLDTGLARCRFSEGPCCLIHIHRYVQIEDYARSEMPDAPKLLPSLSSICSSFSNCESSKSASKLTF